MSANDPNPREGRCHHALCGCPAGSIVVDTHAYCSASCASPEARQVETCPCGHGACRRDHRQTVTKPPPSENPDVIVSPRIVI